MLKLFFTALNIYEIYSLKANYTLSLPLIIFVRNTSWNALLN